METYCGKHLWVVVWTEFGLLGFLGFLGRAGIRWSWILDESIRSRVYAGRAILCERHGVWSLGGKVYGLCGNS